MPKGGARVRSGPAADPNSGRSEQRGLQLTQLPSEGRKGRVPAFPLPKIQRPEFTEGGTKQTTAFRKREIEIWRDIWKTPQAKAWELETWRWSTIAEFCRLKAVVELEPDSNASLVARLREYRNEIGLSPDGLKANGWAIAQNQVAQQAAKKTSAPAKKAAPARRLRAVGGSARR